MVMINDALPDDGTPVPRSSVPGWRDRLVELHVLAEHGDLEAADRATRWLAEDAAAHQAWRAVEHTCAQLRGTRH